jgi:hypothetical protein
MWRRLVAETAAVLLGAASLILLAATLGLPSGSGARGSTVAAPSQHATDLPFACEDRPHCR